ncbi:MAG: DUF2591 family protein [Methylibium sp.]|nr:DUF2591 family protein [Methylibium sp.]
MKHKTAELEGALLDAAVAKIEGMPYIVMAGLLTVEMHNLKLFAPSSDWAHGGTIIERERIALESYPVGAATPVWGATVWPDGADDDSCEIGPTPLIAAMRAFVASKMGDEVELP